MSMKKHVTVVAALRIGMSILVLVAAALVFVGVVGGGLLSGDREAIRITSILDAEDAGGEFFGRERMLNTLWANQDRSAQEIQAALVEAVAEFTRGAVQSDDIALVIAVRKSD